MEESIEWVHVELDEKERYITDQEYEKYAIENSYDIIRVGILELVLENYGKDIEKYNSFILRVNCGIDRKDIIKFNENMKKKEQMQAEYYAIKFDMEYRMSQESAHIDEECKMRFLMVNYEQYRRGDELRREIEKLYNDF